MKRPKQKPNDSKLLVSLKNMSNVLKAEGHIYETHVLLANNWATAHNGVIGVGEPISEDLYACPNAFMLRDALSKCGEGFSITQLDYKLSIKSGKFKALVPCIPPENLPCSFPDASIAQIDNRLRDAIAVVSPITENENSVVTASILIYNGSVTATDRKLILQAWHGISLPTLALPKAIIGPLVKNTKTLNGFGFSNSSCTVHYDDKSWLKSQFFAEQWPNVDDILNKKTNLWDLPEGFYEAVKALEPFSEDGNVYFDNNVMRSHPSEDKGASYEVYGLPRGPIHNIKQLKIVEPYMKKVDFLVPHHNSKMMFFQSDKVRGAIAGRAE